MVKPDGRNVYDNEDQPVDDFPPRNQGRIPVIVRLVNAELGVHYRPATAIRWTRTHVMVVIEQRKPSLSSELAWLWARDVYRLMLEADAAAGPSS